VCCLLQPHLYNALHCTHIHVQTSQLHAQQSATVFITLSDAAQFPPYRIENRSSTATIVYRQTLAPNSNSNTVIPGDTNGAFAGLLCTVLPPLQCHSFLWNDLQAPRELLVALVPDSSSIGSSSSTSSSTNNSSSSSTSCSGSSTDVVLTSAVYNSLHWVSYKLDASSSTRSSVLEPLDMEATAITQVRVTCPLL
jgi:hypothetical protein